MHYHSLFISDIHLGTKQCHIEYLLKFLHDNTFNNVFLIGDTIDFHSLSRNWYWSQDHNTFIQKILRMSRKGTHVVIIPGNHDIILREWIKEISPFFFGDIVIVEEFEYLSIHNQKFLLLHGDKYDGIIRSMHWLYWLGDKTYSVITDINTLYNKIRKLFGQDYWSLSSYLKSQVKETIQIINKFDELVTHECTYKNYDGIIYGHTHTPYIKTINNKIIMNDGDVCENVTCIIETMSGKFQLIKMTNNSILQESFPTSVK